LPAVSVARTENWWEPTARPEYGRGDLQLLYLLTALRLHSNLEPRSVEAKVKLAEVEVVVGAGPAVIEVLGGVVSVAAVMPSAPDRAINRIAMPNEAKKRAAR
jgi:hypothetical protein